LKWTEPQDQGCLEITGYVIEAYQNDHWETVGSSTTTEGVATVTPGVETELRVTASNSIGQGAPSYSIKLTAAALPSAS
jgi:hypothetical protein